MGQEVATTPDLVGLVANNSHPFAYTPAALTGPGAQLLLEATASSQFVLMGEFHGDHAVPIFAGALYRMLREKHGFRHVVVEQDPVAIEEVLAPAGRGDVEHLARLAVRSPGLFEFDSDEDLAFLAEVALLEPGPDAIWGVEQTTGAIRYLEELVALAPDDEVRAQVSAMLSAARAADPGPNYSVNWLAASETGSQLVALSTKFAATPGSRAADLLAGLAKSAEIFGYYFRAQAGEYVGLYNNTVREATLKANFLRRYRAVSEGGATPRALFKFGANHLYRGKNPTNAFPIGNLAHELAIANGLEAFGLWAVPLGPEHLTYAQLPVWMVALLPPVAPTTPTLVDLRPLRPYHRLLGEKVDIADRWQLSALLHGYDAIVLLPGSRPASRVLGGRGGGER